MHLYTGDTGKVYRKYVSSTTVAELTKPSGVGQVFPAVRLDKVLVPGSGVVVMVGQFMDGLIWFPQTRRLRKLGITAPASAPTLAASGAGITGVAIGVYTFAEIDPDGTVIHESNPSPESDTVSLVNQGRSWTNLPTFHPNARVNFKRLYLSMDGDDFLHVANVPLDLSSYTESVATNELDPDEAVSENRGVPPYAKYVTYYAGRVWYSDGSDTIWFSEIDEPESVGATSNIKTRDRRNVTSIRGLADEIVIGTRKSIQYTTGFGLADFEAHFHSRDIGIISHHGSLVVNDKLWFPWQDGYYRYGGGAFQFLMPTLRTYFRDQYEASPSVYEDIVAAVDRRRHIVKVLVPGDSAVPRTARYFVAHYLPCEAELGGNGGLPVWSFDTSTRYERVIESMTDGDLLDRLYSGDCEGYVRLNDVYVAGVQPKDDGTTFDVEIWTKHYFMGAQGGDEAHARTFERLYAFVRSEDTAWTLTLYTGDDTASDGDPTWGPRAVPASALTRSGETLIDKTQHLFEPKASGHGITVKVSATSPIDFEYRGLEIYFRNEGGLNQRAPVA